MANTANLAEQPGGPEPLRFRVGRLEVALFRSGRPFVEISQEANGSQGPVRQSFTGYLDILDKAIGKAVAAAKEIVAGQQETRDAAPKESKEVAEPKLWPVVEHV